MSLETLDEQRESVSVLNDAVIKELRPTMPSQYPAMWATRIFKFFASLPLAIGTLITLMAVLTAGTLIESLVGTEAARLIVYESRWFSLLLFVLGLNLTASALDRLPWKRKHVGFLLTHFGIVLILIGSFVTQKGMLDGQMAIGEGETEHRITLPEPLLYVSSERAGREWVFPLKKKPFVWNGRNRIVHESERQNPFPFDLYLASYYPKARMEEKIVSAETGPAAVQVTLYNSFMNQKQWLVEKDVRFGEVSMGPARLVFSDRFLEKGGEKISETPYLEFRFGDAGVAPLAGALEIDSQRRADTGSAPTPENIVARIPLPKDINPPAEFEIKGTPYKVKILRLLRNAAVEGRNLIEQKGPPGGGGLQTASPTPITQTDRNPAAELILEGNGLQEKHTVFAKFPEFPSMHGMKPSAAGVRIFYHVPDVDPRTQGKNHELRFVKTLSVGAIPRLPARRNFGGPDDGQGESPLLRYQIVTGTEIKTGEVPLGQNVSTGWMDLMFRVENFYPHSKWSRVFVPEPNTTQQEGAVSAIQIELTRKRSMGSPLTPFFPHPSTTGQEGGTELQKRAFWLGQGMTETVSWEGSHYRFLYGERQIPAGFRLELRDFRIEHYPGTERPASFESDVTLKDDSRGVVRHATISMNRPLVYNGFKIYQSGYNLSEGQPEVSVFSVGRDPGVFLKYFGTVVMVAGILIMFYTRKFSSHGGNLA